MKPVHLLLLTIGLPVLVQGGEPMLLRVPASHADHSAAVVVDGYDLLHTTQLLPDGEDGRVVDEAIEKQLDQLLNRLDRILQATGTDRSRIVKLNLYAGTVAAADAMRARLKTWCGHETLPAVCYVETPLPLAGAHVAADAVIAVTGGESANSPIVATHPGHVGPAEWCLMPRGDVVYVSGQAEPGDLATATRATLASLNRTLEHLHLDRSRIVQLKCFLDPMKEVAIVNHEIQSFFGELPVPPVVQVQWSGGSQPIEIELIAHAPAKNTPDGTVSFEWLPWLPVSPIYCRLARIHGDHRIYVSGLSPSAEGNGESQVLQIFGDLEKLLEQTGSGFRHMAKATYYVSDNECSQQLNLIRPSLYDPKRPPAASKAMVQGVARHGRGVTIDMIAAPVAKSRR